jgi:hypothetical protein
MKSKVNTDIVTTFTSHKNYQQSKWKEEGASPFPYNCYNCGKKGHKRSKCRKLAKFNGNQHSSGQYSGGCHSENIYGENISTVVIRNQEGSVQCTEKVSGEGEASNTYVFIAETDNSKVYLSTKKNITWVLDSGARDHLVKEDTQVVNKYELPVPTKIHITKNNNYLLAYAKGDIIAEFCVDGEVKKIKIPDVFLVKDLSYNLLSVSNLDRKGFIINTENGKAEIIKYSTVVGIANRDRNLYKLSMNIKEVDDSGSYPCCEYEQQ